MVVHYILCTAEDVLVRLMDNGGCIGIEGVRSHRQGIEIRIVGLEVLEVFEPLAHQQTIGTADVPGQVLEVGVGEFFQIVPAVQFFGEMKHSEERFAEAFPLHKDRVFQKTHQCFPVFFEKVKEGFKIDLMDVRTKVMLFQFLLSGQKVGFLPGRLHQQRGSGFFDIFVKAGKERQQLVAHIAEKNAQDHVDLPHPVFSFPLEEKQFRGVCDGPQEGSAPQNDDQQGKEPAGIAGGVNVAVAHRGHGDDVVVKGLDKGEVFQGHETEGPQSRYDSEKP
jgi:hypothetical protein